MPEEVLRSPSFADWNWNLKLEREIFCALMRALRYSFMFIT